jgi:hypothetical protein
MEEAVEADRVVVMDHGASGDGRYAREVFRQVERLRSLSLTVPCHGGAPLELRREGFDLPDDRALRGGQCSPRF